MSFLSDVTAAYLIHDRSFAQTGRNDSWVGVTKVYRLKEVDAR